jgi:hypothetical protein
MRGFCLLSPAQLHTARAHALAWQEPPGRHAQPHAAAAGGAPLLYPAKSSTVYYDAVEELGQRPRKSPSARSLRKLSGFDDVEATQSVLL